jgi:nucleotide-binding universal stress UspA family protein
MAVEATPTWKGIVEAADEHNASLIVLGPHRRNGLLGTPVLIIPQRLAGSNLCFTAN